MNLDRFSRPLAGEREPKVVTHCLSCEEPLEEGQEVITWVEDDEFYCDMDCFIRYMDVKEATL